MHAYPHARTWSRPPPAVGHGARAPTPPPPFRPRYPSPPFCPPPPHSYLPRRCSMPGIRWLGHIPTTNRGNSLLGHCHRVHVSHLCGVLIFSMLIYGVACVFPSLIVRRVTRGWLDTSSRTAYQMHLWGCTGCLGYMALIIHHRDGRKLIALVGVVTGDAMPPPEVGDLRVHHIANVRLHAFIHPLQLDTSGIRMHLSPRPHSPSKQVFACFVCDFTGP